MGFFNSVPQDRLLDAVKSLTTKWSFTFDTPTLTIDILATGNPIQLSHIGQHHRRRPAQRTIDTEDIPIVKIALDTCIFQACTTHYKQTRGAGIGPQLSPALCNVAITLSEHSWPQLHHSLTDHSQVHFTQPLRHLQRHFPEPLWRPNLDASRLFWESGGAGNSRTCTTWDSMWISLNARSHYASAGSQRLRLSGLTSRAHLIRNYTYPTSAADRALAHLAHLYAQKGHDLAQRLRAVHRKVLLLVSIHFRRRPLI